MSDEEKPQEEEKPQVRIPEELRVKAALEMLIEHGNKQAEIILGMLGQAELAIEKAMAAANDGPGSTLKMILPIMLGRRKYLRGELEMWRVTLDLLKEDWHDNEMAIERMNAVEDTTEGVDNDEV